MECASKTIGSGLGTQPSSQLRGLSGFVVDNSIVVKLDPGLHDECDDSIPDAWNLLLEDALMNRKCLGSCLGRGCLERMHGMSSSSRNGHLCSDHIDGAIAADVRGLRRHGKGVPARSATISSDGCAASSAQAILVSR